MSRPSLAALLTLLAALAFAAGAFISDPFTGFDPDQFPNPTPPLILQPAGYAFAIWGVIYAWLIASAVFGLLKRGDDPVWQAARWPLIVSMAIGAIWIEVALASPVWATILIFAMLAGALMSLVRCPAHETGWLAAPIALYAGWLSAASFVATATAVTGWTGLDPAISSWIGLLAVGSLGVAVLQLRPPLSYPLALIWALTGVLVASAQNPADLTLFMGAILGAIGAIALTAWRLRPIT
ncbi:MAG: hypothetical protein AAFN09_12165 [Pseudomonadota bacterium]